MAGLVNNAAVRRESDPGHDLGRAGDEVLDVNLGGTFRCCRAVLPGMVYRRRGAIVNISSRSAAAGLPGQTALRGVESGGHGPHPLAGARGGAQGRARERDRARFVATELTAALAPAAVAKLRETECLPAGTATRDVAQAVAFQLSDRAAAITARPSPWTRSLGVTMAAATPREESPATRGALVSAARPGAGPPAPTAGSRSTSRRLLVSPSLQRRALPRPVPLHLPAWVALCSTIFSIVLWNIRNAIAANLEAVLGPCGFWARQLRIYRTIEAFSWCYGARYEQMVHPGRFQVEVEGAEHIPHRPRARRDLRDRPPRQWELSSHLASHGLARPCTSCARRRWTPRPSASSRASSGP